MSEKIQFDNFANTDPGSPPPEYSAAMMNNPPPPQGPATLPPNTQGAPFQSAGFQTQPAPTQWYMGSPGLGLHLFDNLSEVKLERVVDMMDAMVNVPQELLRRQFRVTTPDNQQLFFMTEDENISGMSNMRAFQFTAKDSHGEDVFLARRDEMSCTCFCCPCTKACRPEVEILTAKQQSLGTLRMRCPPCNYLNGLEDGNGTELLTVRGTNQGFCSACQPPTQYEIEMKDGSGSKGSITKIGTHWGTALNKYTMKFPTNMNSELKACCVGIIISFDFIYHALRPRRRHNSD